ncbi:MAG: NADH-ubiquinone oxidoreductase-F iron-sulfur binding region domain-containing protein [Candidatus Electrothrix aestuarii]|uniref:NADH-ubiquinone oxidoreductase-F iron-sulfur binding region domain-containing protein n=1 Tax=Candidatus Electrothrix aestuarii TaxID=3062594 RepID=A0AAU8LTD6_9BACT|nr:NADH-ubiquinone oxidoreductase-F iron-sulfur binding region domain-containing protein [Candidatus Electrothrix aestuarii]
MSEHIAALSNIAAKYDNDPNRLLDILIDVQAQERCVTDDAARQLAREVGLSWADIHQTVSFYHLLSETPRGEYTIYLNNGPVAIMQGYEEVAAAFSEAAGCPIDSVTEDGRIGIFATADMGMGDQEVAALINKVVFTCLTPEKARALVKAMQEGQSVQDMVTKYGEYGDGNNSLPSIGSMVRNNIQKAGPVCFGPYEFGVALRKCVTLSPEEVLAKIKASKLRGRGGAGFPTGMKWELCAKAPGPERCVVANADEGEPGTFKDRVLLTERAELFFEGMAVCAYAVGASTGALYLRGEYTYLREYLEQVLDQMRADNLLGKDIAGKAGFDFDIRVQLGAGSYVCGEESALLESAEGKRGEPRNRPPFPAQSGYRAMPTVIDNVETLASAAQIIDKGAAWFSRMGTEESTGTKVLSISGDCARPGIYEVEFGITLGELLDMAGAQNPQAVQVGGPSGRCLNAAEKDTPISFEGCPSAGAFLIIGVERDLLEIIDNFMAFFTDESCGSCSSCRAGTWMLRNTLRRIRQGQGTREDLTSMRQLSAVMQKTTKCGLGHTAPHPILNTLDNFPHLYEALIPEQSDIRVFDLDASIKAANATVGRTSVPDEKEEEQV